MSEAAHKETRQFQTEVRQLLDLMIHSLYSNKEIFLRELISNASDASDKLRFEALSDDALYEGQTDLDIRITFDKAARTITVTDRGIGMSHDEVIANVGTIAKSGTREFLSALSGEQSKEANLIGQFGVGFYSAFIVAERVTLETRRAGLAPAQGVRWESAGEGEYTLEHMERPQRGTTITLHLREGMDEFLDDWRLRSIIRKFSDHISWPILMPQQDFGDKEKGSETASSAPEWETVNSAAALWTRPKSEIKAEEYTEFYKHVAHDFDDPLAHIHARLEGNLDYTLLLYLPKRPPFDMWDRERSHGVKLYVRRVFIMEGKEELMPRYLRFVRGVIDSADLPLNISREILQQDRTVAAIRKGAVGKVLGLLDTLSKEEEEKYQAFWKTFGQVLKEGVIEDPGHQEKLAKLLRFATTHSGSPEETVSLADYAARMKEGQEKIYYVIGETHAAANSSPHLEVFRKKGIEVLLLSDRIDEWMVEHLNAFDGKPLHSISRGDLDLGELEDAAEKQEQEKAQDQFKPLLERMQGSLGEAVKGVRMSHRLTDSPACLVSDQHDMTPTMERILKSAGQEVPATKRYLELNPHHPLVQRLNGEGNDERFNDWSRILLDQALLSEGGQLEDPAGFVGRLNKMLLVLSGS